MLGKCYKDNDLNELTSQKSDRWFSHFNSCQFSSLSEKEEERRGGEVDQGRGEEERKGRGRGEKREGRKGEGRERKRGM